MPNEDIQSILYHCHGLNCGGPYGYQRTTSKVLESRSIGQQFFNMQKGLFKHVIYVQGVET